MYIGIIGIKGRFGQLLQSFFESIGLKVIGSDIVEPGGLSNEEVVRRSDVVVFSLPIKDTAQTIRALRSCFRKDQLVMDVTSIKQPIIDAMLETRGQVVGLHPMFRPEVSFRGQTIVVCPARLTDPAWEDWLRDILKKTGAKIKWSGPAEHDSFMTIVQAIPHLANLTTALLITERGISARESLEFTSPFYRVMFSLMGRLISQNPALYTSIILENPKTAEMLRKRIAIEGKLLDIIERKDEGALGALFLETRAHFGADVTTEANELFQRILGLLSTLNTRNAVTLEFSKADSQPGLLEKVMAVFRHHEVNLTGINSVELAGGRMQFTISFEEDVIAVRIEGALEEIRGWTSPVMKVIVD